jgi:hypothetical protein
MYILQYQGKSFLSKSIRFRTWSVYSHSAILPMDKPEDMSWTEFLNRSYVYEAWIDSMIPPRGDVKRSNGFSEMHTPNTMVDVYKIVPPPGITFDSVAARDYAESMRGTPYDFSGAFGFVTRRDGAQDPKKLFCSEYAFLYCRAGGLVLLNHIAPHKVYPGLLPLSPYLQYVQTAFTNPPEKAPIPFDPLEAIA